LPRRPDAEEDTISDLSGAQFETKELEDEPETLLGEEELGLEDDGALEDEDELGGEGDVEVELDGPAVAELEFEVGDSVVYPHHGAGKVLRKEEKEVLGERREYLTIEILHNHMTVMVPTANAALAGLRRVIDEQTVQKVLAVLGDECSEMPKNWNRRYKHNRDKIKTGDIYELAEVVRNLAIRESQKGLSTGEKQMYTRAKKILASELMYALEMNEEEVEAHLTSLLLDHHRHGNGKAPAAAA
jgi:CarD family transcriptional regulator